MLSPLTRLEALRAAGRETAVGWQSKIEDAALGLDYNHARWYAPALGRFTQSSPIGGWFEQPYGYGFNSPMAAFDVDGLVPRWMRSLGYGLRVVGDTAWNTTLDLTWRPITSGAGGVANWAWNYVDGAKNVNAIAARDNEILCALGETPIDPNAINSDIVDLGAEVVLSAGGAAMSQLRLVDGMTMRTDDALDAAHDYLGPGHIPLENGRYLSADGLRQVRMGRHELNSVRPHINFETRVPIPGQPGRFRHDQDVHIYIQD